MKPTNLDDIFELLNASCASAALGAAIELGLFWTLEKRPLTTHEVARELGIPPVRCRYWLQLLCGLNLIEQKSSVYVTSSTARSAILEVYSQDSWRLLAQEARERLPSLCNLPLHLREHGTAPTTRSLALPSYVAKMAEDPERALRFTRMLYELHQPIADYLADILDMTKVDRLMDLGGGSGVVSLSLLNRHPQLTAVVVDIDSVCVAGRTIAAEHSQGERIVYHAADFLRDELPSGFGMVLECDVNIYSEALFHKVWAALDPGGYFVIVDQLSPAEGVAPPSRIHWAFQGSLVDPEFCYPTVAAVQAQLAKVGFRILSERTLPAIPGPSARFTRGLTMIEARK